jgi:chaperone BCS1
VTGAKPNQVRGVSISGSEFCSIASTFSQMEQQQQQYAVNTVPAVSNTPAIPTKENALKQLAGGGGGDGSIFQQLTSNPFFTAGFGLAGLGAALRIGQQGLRRGGELLKRRMLVDLEITRHDESYPWVLNWMTRQYQKSLADTPETVYVI